MRGFRLRSLPSVCACLSVASLSSAQVKFDGTVGPPGNLAGNEITIPSDRGRLVGNNLFHSFSRFDVPASGSVRFQGPGSVSNVLARVTGGRASRIDGTLACDIPGANLLLINPKGVVFGSAAQVQIDGSFVATTADRIDLPEGGRFSASSPGNDVLTTGSPVSFGFVSGAPAGIYADGANLNLAEGRSHALLGGEVRIANGKLVAPRGSIRIVSVGGVGNVPAGKDGASPQPAEGTPGADMTLASDSRIDVSSASGPGTVQLIGRHLDIDRSTISAGNKSGPPGDGITIALTGDLTLTSSRVETATRGPGAAAPVKIAGRSIVMSGDPSKLLTGVDTSSGSRDRATNEQITGRAGDATVQATTLRLLNGARIDTSTYTRGAGGDIVASVSGDVYLADETGNRKPPPYNFVDQPDQTRDTGLIARTVGNFAGAGMSGDIEFSSNNLTIGASGIITSTTRALGDAGSVSVDVTERISIDMPPVEALGLRTSGGILSQSLPEVGPDSGRGGSVLVRAGIIDIHGEQGAAIATATRGNGIGGSLRVEADEIRVSGREGIIHAFSRRFSNGPAITGAAGSVEVHARRLHIFDRGQVSVRSNNDGPAGELSIFADIIEISGEGAITATTAQTSGGNATIVTDFLSIDDASITANAGGDGGNLLLLAPQVNLQQAVLSANSVGGDGGNLTILSLPLVPDALLFGRNSAITAKAEAGRGGQILINAPHVDFVVVDIDASGGQGDPGTVDITTTFADLTGALVPIDASLRSPQARLYDCCESLISRDLSSFVVIGRGIPLDPMGWTPMNFQTLLQPSKP